MTYIPKPKYHTPVEAIKAAAKAHVSGAMKKLSEKKHLTKEPPTEEQYVPVTSSEEWLQELIHV